MKNMTIKKFGDIARVAHLIAMIDEVELSDFVVIDSRFKGKQLQKWINKFTHEWKHTPATEMNDVPLSWFVAYRMIEKLDSLENKRK